jgi:hypothetical protein
MKLNYYPDNASQKVELKQLTLSKLPLMVQTISA